MRQRGQTRFKTILGGIHAENLTCSLVFYDGLFRGRLPPAVIVRSVGLEVSFHQEIESLRLGQGEEFHGEGILAVTKALLQSGVSYVGGYQGAPVSHLLDVMVQAKPLMQELGVHVEACANEASAAAMLGASIHYPLRGAVTWKSIVGTKIGRAHV